MSILSAGLSYRRVSLDLLERLAFDASALPKALASLRSFEPVREAAILSTCNRVEVYAVVDGFHAGLASVKSFLAGFNHVSEDEFAGVLDIRHDDDAVRHLLSVACGIDSAVVGEPQILAQVRTAFRVASEEGAVGPELDALLRHAIRAGRRARAETTIASSGTSYAAACVAIAREAVGSLAGRTVLVAGAGAMSEAAARSIAAEGAVVLVSNRTASRGRALAQRIGAEEVAAGTLEAALARADLVLSSTASPETVFTRAMIAEAMRTRPGRPLFLIDLAVPRDVDPSAAEVPGVTLRDLDDLRDAVAPGAGRDGAVEAVRAIVEAEVPRFARWRRTQHLAPLLKALQDRGETIRLREIERAAAKLGRLDRGEREAVEAMTRAIVAKLLHGPVDALKGGAGTAGGESLSRLLRQMFDLPEES